MRGGGRAGRGNGGTIRHCSCLGHPEQGGGGGGAISSRAFVVCTQSVGSPPPLGEGARDGCGRQPLRGGKGGRLCRGTRPCHPAGATDCAQYGWGRGGFAGGYNRQGICYMQPYRNPPREGWGVGWQGQWRHRPPLLLPWNSRAGRGLAGAIIGGAFVLCSHFGWEPTPWGEGARDGCGRQPLRGGKGGRLCRGTRPCHPAGATDCAQYGWGRGGTMRLKGICAPELRGRRGLTCDMRDYRSR